MGIPLYEVTAGAARSLPGSLPASLASCQRTEWIRPWFARIPSIGGWWTDRSIGSVGGAVRWLVELAIQTGQSDEAL